MVNLLQMYEAHGFEMSRTNCPITFLVFGIFIATETGRSHQIIRGCHAVLSLLGARLAERAVNSG